MKRSTIPVIIFGTLISGLLVADIAVRIKTQTIVFQPSSIPPPPPMVPISINKPLSVLVGHWVPDDPKEDSYAFFSDGTGKTSAMTFRWKVVSPKALELDF